MMQWLEWHKILTMRYPLIDGHGNFGSIDGDGAAAYALYRSKNV